MKEMKCKNCGATIHIDENVKTTTCNYCGSTYSSKDQVTYNFNINMNDNTKEVFNNAFNSVNNVPQKVISIFVIFFVFSFIISITFSILRFNVVEDTPSYDNWENTKEKYDDFDKEIFNSKYEWYEGEQSLFFMDFVFDSIIEDNLEGNHIITIFYNDIEAISEEEIDNLRNSLEDKKYNLHFEKDSEGYINKLVISE